MGASYPAEMQAAAVERRGVVRGADAWIDSKSERERERYIYIYPYIYIDGDRSRDREIER